MIKSLIQRAHYATQAVLPYASTPPKYVLSTLRSFPSLEPHSAIPVANAFFNAPLRRDILWRAVIMEQDCERVGASNPPGRGDHKYSRRKLRPQKGSGRARVGDGNSPTRENGAYAHARTAPNDFSTELPFKVYSYAYRVALSSFYKKGNLFVVGSDGETASQCSENDTFGLEIKTNQKQALDMFTSDHKLKNLNLLFIPNDIKTVPNLKHAAQSYKKRVSVMRKEEVLVKDLLKAHRVYIEKDALNFLAKEFGGK